jgi:hypothetical protein
LFNWNEARTPALTLSAMVSAFSRAAACILIGCNVEEHMARLHRSAFGIALLLLTVFASHSNADTSADAQSNRDVRVAVDQLRATLVSTLDKLRATLITENSKLAAAEKSSTGNLKTGLLRSLNQELSALAEVTTALNTIQDKQERRVDPNHLYCSAAFSYGSNQIGYCFLANSPNVQITKTFDAIQQEGWHLTATGPTASVYTLLVYSKYVE